MKLTGLVFALVLGELKKNHQSRFLCLHDEVNSEGRWLEETEVCEEK